MFDLNKEVAKWKQSLCANDTCSKEDVAELESHLYDSMENLQGNGLSEQESFFVAIHRLGSPDALTYEFGKINENMKIWNMLFHAGIGIVLYIVINNLSSAATNAVRVLLSQSGLGPVYIGHIGPILGNMVLLVLSVIIILIMKNKRAGLARFFSRPAGNIVLVLSILVLVAGGIVISNISNIYLTRSIAASDYGRMFYISSIYGLVLSIIKPIAIVIAVVMLWNKKRLRFV